MVRLMVNLSSILLAANEAGQQVADMGTMLKTIAMGMGIVFVGLICIIFICKLMSAVVRAIEKKPDESAPAVSAAPAAPAVAPVENRGALSAAIAAAIAEEMGTDVSGIRILSIKRK